MIQCGKLPALQDIQIISKGTERFNIVFQQYPLRYRLSEKRRAELYTAKDKIGVKLQKLIDDGDCVWKIKKPGETTPKLYNVKEKDWVIANPKSVGTPKDVPINGQDFWSSGQQQQWNRIKLKEQLMEYFIPRILQQLPKEIKPFNKYTIPSDEYVKKRGQINDRFIQIEYIFFRNWTNAAMDARNVIQDIDNHAYPYMKIFKDTLQHLGIIAGDDPRYIRGGYPHYVHIDNDEERRLEVKIHFCTNEQAIQRPIYEYYDTSVPKSDLLTDHL